MKACKIVTALFSIALPAVVAAGDVVYLRDGSTREGTARREGDKVIVQTETQTLELPGEQVLYISRPEQQPAETTTAPQDEQAPTPAPTGPWRFPLNDVRQPEVMVFSTMRSLARKPRGAATEGLEQSVRRWQIAVQDRKRKIGQGNWASPDEFLRRRNVYANFLSQAKEIYEQIQQAKRRKKPSDPQPDTSALEARFHRMLWQAANSWADPLLGDFLVALAWYKAENWSDAEKFFARCQGAAPDVAGFHQARGAALLKLNRPMEALKALTEALKRRPDARFLSPLLGEAVQEIPGWQTEDPAYAEAARLLRSQGYRPGQMPARIGQTQWLMPGDDWPSTPQTLPTPPYDRLVFKQALAVPAGASALVVDAEVVEDALEVYVEVGEGDWAPVQIGRRGPRRTPGVRGLTVLNLPGQSFQPVVLVRPGEVTPGQVVEGHGLGRFQQMGSAVRTFAIETLPGGGANQINLNGGLLAGESAGPVFTEDGRLVGFLAARADPMAENGGPDRLIPADRLRSFWGAAGGSPRPPGAVGAAPVRNAPGGRADSAKRIYVVHAIFSESLE